MWSVKTLKKKLNFRLSWSKELPSPLTTWKLLPRRKLRTLLCGTLFAKPKKVIACVVTSGQIYWNPTWLTKLRTIRASCPWTKSLKRMLCGLHMWPLCRKVLPSTQMCFAMGHGMQESHSVWMDWLQRLATWLSFARLGDRTILLKA